MSFHKFGSWRILVCAAVLAAGLVAGPMTSGHAGATFTTCHNCTMIARAALPDGLQIPR